MPLRETRINKTVFRVFPSYAGCSTPVFPVLKALIKAGCPNILGDFSVNTA